MIKTWDQALNDPSRFFKESYQLHKDFYQDLLSRFFELISEDKVDVLIMGAGHGALVSFLEEYLSRVGQVLLLDKAREAGELWSLFAKRVSPEILARCHFHCSQVENLLEIKNLTAPLVLFDDHLLHCLKQEQRKKLWRQLQGLKMPLYIVGESIVCDSPEVIRPPFYWKEKELYSDKGFWRSVYKSRELEEDFLHNHCDIKYLYYRADRSVVLPGQNVSLGAIQYIVSLNTHTE